MFLINISYKNQSGQLCVRAKMDDRPDLIELLYKLHCCSNNTGCLIGAACCWLHGLVNEIDQVNGLFTQDLFQVHFKLTICCYCI